MQGSCIRLGDGLMGVPPNGSSGIIQYRSVGDFEKLCETLPPLPVLLEYVHNF